MVNHKTGTWKICPVCGTSFWERPSRAKKTCSRSCWAVYMRGERNPRYKPKIKTNCNHCGKEMLIWPALKDRKHFCSKECRYKWRSENVRGAKVHNWQGGKGFGKYCEKFNFSFKERVRIFFHRKCFVCGCDEINERHHVHHINFNPKACCDDSEREFIILCRSCHANATNSADRDETARCYSMQMQRMTIDGKCYYTKCELKELESKIKNLQKLSRWDLSHLLC